MSLLLRRTCEPAHLLQRPAAQFGPIGHRRSLAAAARSEREPKVYVGSTMSAGDYELTTRYITVGHVRLR